MKRGNDGNRLRGWRQLGGGLIVAALGAGVVGAQARDDVNRIRLADGSVVTVPRAGALADDRATALANGIAALDERADAKIDGIADLELRQAVLDMVMESRNLAADKLGLAYRVAQTTSAGSLDADVLKQGAEALRKATDLLSNPPVKLFVHTQISVNGPDHGLQYVTAAQYRRKEDLWRNYTAGQDMKIGDYVFRLSGRGGDGPWSTRRLEIRSDPTLQVFEPSPR